MTIAWTDDYRDVLKQELDARCANNDRYSLRAFARDLELAPSRLSEILNGKQGLSPKAASTVAVKMGLRESEQERFRDLVASRHARSKTDREAAKIRLRRYEMDSEVYQMQVDSFRAIADWYHIAIIELAEVAQFQSDPVWIARKLGISPVQADVAIERLIRLKLLRRNDDGTLEPTHDDGNIGDDIPSASIRKFHTQILAKATQALTKQNVEDREFGTCVLAIDQTQMEDYKDKLRQFQHEFCNEVKQAPRKDAVYCISVQFFAISKEGEHHA